MHKKCSLFIALLLCISMLPGMSFAHAGYDSGKENVNIFVRGKLLETDDSFIQGGRTFLPLRLVGESMGYDVRFDSVNKELHLKKGLKVMNMQIGEKEYDLNGISSRWMSHLF